MIRNSPLLEFMESFYEILPPAPIVGKFFIKNSPWLAEPMFALCDPSIREVTTQFAAQGGKNLISEGFISYTILHAPGNILFYGQTDEDAETFATTRALKRARSIPILKHVWPDTKSAAKHNQVHLDHLTLEFLGVNPSNARGKSAPYVICDEKHLKVWKGMGKVVRKRCSAFWDHKVLNISTAGDEGSEIDDDFKRGTMEDWHLGCPSCNKLVKLTWSEDTKSIIWEAPEDQWRKIHPEKGKWNFRELGKHIRFRCPWCGCEERDTMPTRREMNLLGGYVAENENASSSHRSFHCSQIAYPWVSWELIVEEWITAIEKMKTGDVSNLRNFVIETLGQTWVRRVDNTGNAHITGGYSLAEPFQWDEEADRFATVDVQERGGRHFWIVIRAWAKDGKSRLVTAARAETWEHVQQIIADNGVAPRRVGVDSRFATKEVKEKCAQMDWHFLIADATRDDFQTTVGKAKVRRPFMKASWADTGVRTAVRYAHGFIFSKKWARDVVANRIAGQGTEWGLPNDVKNLTFVGTSRVQSSYLSQLNSWVEKEVMVKSTNEVKRDWVQVNGDDHLRSCEEMQLVLAGVAGYIPSELSVKEGD